MASKKGNLVVELNRFTPIAAKVQLGTLLEAIIASLNAQRTDHNTLVAKLNLDAGVTDTNYAVSTASAVTPPSQMA